MRITLNSLSAKIQKKITHFFCIYYEIKTNKDISRITDKWKYDLPSFLSQQLFCQPQEIQRNQPYILKKKKKKPNKNLF